MKCHGTSDYGLSGTPMHTAGRFLATTDWNLHYQVLLLVPSDTACLSHLHVVRRELEQLEKRLKAEKVTVDKERRRLDTIRADHMDALIKKVGLLG